MKRTLCAAVSLALLAPLGGCYRYITTPIDAVAPGTEVRVYVSRRGLAEIPDVVPTSATYLGGRFGRLTADSLLLQVSVSRRVDGPGALDLRQNVLLPTAEIVGVERRELHRSRTAMALIGGVGLVAGIVGVVADAGGSGDAPTGGAAGTIRIPLFSVQAP